MRSIILLILLLGFLAIVLRVVAWALHSTDQDYSPINQKEVTCQSIL